MKTQRTTQKETKTLSTLEERTPVVVVVGHIDHGKSTLLDYIRKTAVADREEGGITQHLSAYEVPQTDDEGHARAITFLDTPGHEAFSAMRSRGLEVADIAILIVSAEDGVMPQTLESVKLIKEYKLPFIVALTKIDKPNANIDRTKASLLENEIYIEGMGGDVPCVPISSKTGEGVTELLGMVLLVADLAELQADKSKLAEGIVIESHRDPKRGISATLIIKDGTLKNGEYIVSGQSTAPTRIMENFLGKSVSEVSSGSPVTVVGFSTVPKIGDPFHAVSTKKEAELHLKKTESSKNATQEITKDKDTDKLDGVSDKSISDASEKRTEDIPHTIPVVVKADALGSIDAIKHEIAKIDTGRAQLHFVIEDVGTITKNDIQSLVDSENPLVIGFNVEADAQARELARRHNIPIESFSIIYKLTEWLSDAIKNRTPKIKSEECTARARVLKTFSKTRNKQVIGGRVEEGVLRVKKRIRIIRKEEVVGSGTLSELQAKKNEVREVEAGNEFGAQIESKCDILVGDIIECVEEVEK
jgi:translation initiation factor IF-2